MPDKSRYVYLYRPSAADKARCESHGVLFTETYNASPDVGSVNALATV